MEEVWLEVQLKGTLRDESRPMQVSEERRSGCA
jgi:hypothetical protein